MRQDLDTLKTEIEQSLGKHGFAVFRGQYRGGEGIGEIYWDSARYPQPQDFLEAAAKLDVKVIVFHDRTLTADMLSEALEKLEAAQLPREEYREIERGIAKLKGFEDFTCSLQLSFDFDHNTYLFEARTKWYEEFLILLDDLDDTIDAGGEDDEPGPMGGYFSHN
jgi:hypothetical protein